MRKSIAAVTLTASVALGGLAGAVLGTPGLAGAQEAASDAAGWVEGALSGLVEDGTITQQQANAVEQALEDARPEGGFLHHGPMALDAIAEVLGMTEDELQTALEDDQTLAEIAQDQGVGVQRVVDAIVAEHQERLDQAVADGDLTQAEADEMLADAAEHATDLVQGELPAFGPGMHGPGGPGGPFGPPPGADDSAAEGTGTAA